MEHPEDELDAGAVLLHHHARLLHLPIIVELLVEPGVEQGAIGALHLHPEHRRVRRVGCHVDGQDVRHRHCESRALSLVSYRDTALFVKRFIFTES